MTYLFKLAQRIAKIRLPIVVTLLGVVGCSKGDKTEFLAPNPNQNTPVLNSLRIEPQITSVRVGSEVQFIATGYTATGAVTPVTVDWSAVGGIITPDGRYTGVLTGSFVVRASARERAGVADSARIGVWENTTDLVAVVVSPDSALVFEGDTLDLDAALQMAGGALTGDANVTWSSDGGVIDQAGRFTAPVEGEYVVSAVSVNNLRGNARVFVRRRGRLLTGIRLSPGAVTTSPGVSTTFSALADWDNGSSSAADAEWSATGGTIVGGVYVAGGQAGQYRVIARQSGSEMADTAGVTIASPTVVRLVVSPGTLTLATSASRQLSAQAEMSDGSWENVPLAWQANGGTISQSGLFTAPGSPGSHLVIVTTPVSAAADTAFVSVVTPVANLTGILLNPSSATVAAGSSRQFDVTGVWSDGSSATPAVTWSADGGAISAGGLYTAGTVPGSFTVIATTNGGLADTSAVTVSGAVLGSLVVSPATASLQSGQTRQFTASGVWSDGSTTVPPVTWTAAGGSITSAGLYTAGSVPGTYPVTATHGGGMIAAGYVTISTAVPTLTGILLTPTSVALAPGAIQQFSALGMYSNGTTGSVGITWSATGGSVNTSGRYTAGTAAGNYRVIARRSGGTLADTSSIGITIAPTVVSLAISPKPASLPVNGTQQFSLTALWSNGSTTVPPIVWTATGGSVSGTGLYSAGAATGSYRVIAQHQGGTRADTAAVTLTSVGPPPATLTALTVSPKPTSVQAGATRQFSVSAVWSDGSTTLPSITWSSTGGSISSGGLYAAGATTGTFQAIASGGGLADTAVVTVTTGTAPTLTSLIVSPDPVTKFTGATQQFAVSALWSNGGTTLPTITWTATGGTISSGGLYTAGGTPGTYQAIASGGGKADTASVTLNAAVLTQFTLSPASVTLAAGSTQQFQTAATWSDGVNRAVSVVYTGTGGTISVNGLYSAGLVVGTFAVIATCGCGAADTTAVFVTAPAAATLTSLQLTPAAMTLAPSGTQQLSIGYTWSNGSTTAPLVSFTATGGGSVSGGQLYTAPGTPGTYQIIASHIGGTLMDTSVVTVSGSAPPPPTGGLYVNRPANYTTVLSDYAFNDSYPNGTATDQPVGGGWNLIYWLNGGISTVTKVSDPTGPISPSNVLQWKYYAGGPAGGVGDLYHSLPNVNRIYVAFALKHDANFEFNGVSNKLFYLEPGNFILQSRHDNDWYSLYKGGTAYTPSINTPITKGTWEMVEILADGVAGNVKVWINGQLRTNQNISFTQAWNQMKLDSTWGGFSVPRTRDSYRWVDHIFVATP